MILSRNIKFYVTANSRDNLCIQHIEKSIKKDINNEKKISKSKANRHCKQYGTNTIFIGSLPSPIPNSISNSIPNPISNPISSSIPSPFGVHQCPTITHNHILYPVTLIPIGIVRENELIYQIFMDPITGTQLKKQIN